MRRVWCWVVSLLEIRRTRQRLKELEERQKEAEIATKERELTALRVAANRAGTGALLELAEERRRELDAEKAAIYVGDAADAFEARP